MEKRVKIKQAYYTEFYEGMGQTSFIVIRKKTVKACCRSNKFGVEWNHFLIILSDQSPAK